MSFSTMNGINAASGGLSGTRRAPIRQPVTWSPEGPAGSHGPTMPTSAAPPAADTHLYTRAGLAGTQMAGGDTSNSSYGMSPYRDIVPGGVKPGREWRTPLAGPEPIQFDPNDPNNAALAGYMNGA